MKIEGPAMISIKHSNHAPVSYQHRGRGFAPFGTFKPHLCFCALVLLFAVFPVTAKPIIDLALRKELGQNQINQVMAFAGQFSDRKVTEIIQTIDSPPAGEWCLIVRFEEQLQSGTTYEATHLTVYNKNKIKHPESFPKENRRHKKGQWISSGELSKHFLEMFPFSEGHVFVDLDAKLPYQDALAIVKSIDEKSYRIAWNSGNAEWDEEQKKTPDSETKRLFKAADIYAIRSEFKDGVRKIIVQTEDKSGGYYEQTFIQEEGGLMLIARVPFFY